MTTSAGATSQTPPAGLRTANSAATATAAGAVARKLCQRPIVAATAAQTSAIRAAAASSLMPLHSE